MAAAVIPSPDGGLIVACDQCGDPEPSREDFEITRRLVKAGEIIGIPVLDHVVIATRGHVSIVERGW